MVIGTRIDMRFSLPTTLSTYAIFAVLCSSQTVIQNHGITTQPADGTVVAPGDSFPFSFTPTPFGTDACLGVYHPIDVYLSTLPPTPSDVRIGGSVFGGVCILADGSFVNDLGLYLVSLFGQSRSILASYCALPVTY